MKQKLKVFKATCLLTTLMIGFCLLNIGTLLAQSNYLEHLGTSEAELMVFLDFDPDQHGMERSEQQLVLKKEGLEAEYSFHRGKVAGIRFFMCFDTREEADEAFHEARIFMQTRGLEMNNVPDQLSYHAITGEGNGYHSTLVLAPDGAKHRLVATLTTVHSRVP